MMKFSGLSQRKEENSASIPATLKPLQMQKYLLRAVFFFLLRDVLCGAMRESIITAMLSLSLPARRVWD